MLRLGVVVQVVLFLDVEAFLNKGSTAATPLLLCTGQSVLTCPSSGNLLHSHHHAR